LSYLGFPGIGYHIPNTVAERISYGSLEKQPGCAPFHVGPAIKEIAQDAAIVFGWRRFLEFVRVLRPPPREAASGMVNDEVVR
jgi:hypothetical protein